MKNKILNLGKPLNKKEQKLINGGGYPGHCRTAYDCWRLIGFIGTEDSFICINGKCAFNPGY